MNPYRDLEVANVAGYLPRTARDRPNALALAVMRRSWIAPFGSSRFDQVSYGRLHEQASHVASGLREVGLVPGDRVVLMVPPSLPFFALVFGLFQAGIVPVILDPAMGPKRLTACIDRAEPRALLGIGKALVAARVFGWGSRSITVRVAVGAGRWLEPAALSLDELSRRGERNPRAMMNVREDDTAAILFTSGSTGVPKGAVYSHGNFLAQVEAIRSMYGIEPGEVDVPTFPLFALFDPAFGMTTVIPDIDFTRPGKASGHAIIEPITKYRATTMFGSPAILARILDAAEPNQLRLPTLRRVVTAGAPVQPRILERFARLLHPDARIHTPYGATESLPLASIDHLEVLGDVRAKTDAGAGICVGRLAPGATVSIQRIIDGPLDRLESPLPPYTTGEICAAGPQVTRSYLRDEANTHAHKVMDDNGTLFHRVGDVGYLDELGRLWFCGRKAHRVITPEGTLYSEQVEGPFLTLSRVRRAALVGPRARNGVVVPVILLEAAHPPPPIKLPAGAVPEPEIPLGLRSTPAGQVALITWWPESFPVDPRHNAKIDRDALRTAVEHGYRDHLDAHLRGHHLEVEPIDPDAYPWFVSWRDLETHWQAYHRSKATR